MNPHVLQHLMEWADYSLRQHLPKALMMDSRCHIRKTSQIITATYHAWSFVIHMTENQMEFEITGLRDIERKSFFDMLRKDKENQDNKPDANTVKHAILYSSPDFYKIAEDLLRQWARTSLSHVTR